MPFFLPWKRSSRADHEGSTLSRPNNSVASSETIEKSLHAQMKDIRETMRACETRLIKGNSSKAAFFDGWTDTSAKHTIQELHGHITAYLSDQ